MMRFRLKGRTLLNADIISPEITYAVFSDELIEFEAEKIVNELTHGSRVLGIIAKYQGTLDIFDKANMVRELKDAYADYSYDAYSTREKQRSKL